MVEHNKWEFISIVCLGHNRKFKIVICLMGWFLCVNWTHFWTTSISFAEKIFIQLMNENERTFWIYHIKKKPHESETMHFHRTSNSARKENANYIRYEWNWRAAIIKLFFLIPLFPHKSTLTCSCFIFADWKWKWLEYLKKNALPTKNGNSRESDWFHLKMSWTNSPWI